MLHEVRDNQPVFYAVRTLWKTPMSVNTGSQVPCPQHYWLRDHSSHTLTPKARKENRPVTMSQLYCRSRKLHYHIMIPLQIVRLSSRIVIVIARSLLAGGGPHITQARNLIICSCNSFWQGFPLRIYATRHPNVSKNLVKFCYINYLVSISLKFDPTLR